MTHKGGIFINNLAEYRKRKNFSQLELSRMVNVSRQTINMIENNKYNPSLNLCINICLVLNATLNDIFWKE
ncbi:helix-turn-helix transcriptional regulator [Staphylococcus hyicus]|uniref:helix-turn-helix transcriptional regulator n=1 Tax=Staphylococcus hyicus TaxID=1284 RepID=UPI003C7DFA57